MLFQAGIFYLLLAYANAKKCDNYKCSETNQKIAFINSMEYECPNSLICNAKALQDTGATSCEPCVEPIIAACIFKFEIGSTNKKFKFNPVAADPSKFIEYDCPKNTEFNDDIDTFGCHPCKKLGCEVEWECVGNKVIINKNIEAQCATGFRCNAEKDGCDACVAMYPGNIIISNSAASALLSWGLMAIVAIVCWFY